MNPTFALRFFLAVAAVAAPAAATPARAQNRDATVVAVDAVRREPMRQTAPVVGRIISRRTGVVAARIGGPVAEFKVEVGDRVEAGDTVAVLVKTKLKAERALKRAEVKEAEAALRSAKAARDLRAQELERLRKLRTSAAFSQARLDDKRLELAAAQSAMARAAASLERARADLELADIALRDADIRAPYGGVISERYGEVGAYLKAGDPVVALINDRSLEIEADVPAGYIRGLKPGATVSFQIDSRRRFAATVRAVVPDENPLTRTRLVRFTPDLAGYAGPLAANQSVTLRVPASAARSVLTVHKDAVLERRGKTLVFVVDNGAAVLRRVRLGEAVGGRFEVIDGLKIGDLVVVRGNERLIPGQKVSFTPGSEG